MDANGARELAKRLEAHEHWRQADAVRSGDQPAADPDAHALEEVGDGIRRYRREADNEPSFCKRLVAGRWEVSTEPA